MSIINTIIFTALTIVWLLASIVLLISALQSIVYAHRQEMRDKEREAHELEYHDKQMEALR